MPNAPRNKKPHRRPGQIGMLVGVRIQPKQLAAIDKWRSSEEDVPTRPEAIRRLLSLVLEQ